MAKPSLQASPEGRQLAAQTIRLSGLTKKGLSEAVGCSRQPVTNFFKGVAIERGLFVELCDRLNLDWRQVAGLTTPLAAPQKTTRPFAPNAVQPAFASSETQPESEVTKLVQQLRGAAKQFLYERCGTMRVLDMAHPVGLNEIYTDVNILEKVSSYQRRTLDDLIADMQASQFDRVGFGQIAQPRVPVMDAVDQHKKLIVLGKPGAGKTTFLKHLAIQCIEGHFETSRLPLYVNLKQFAEHPDCPGILAFVSESHFTHQISAVSGDQIQAQLLALKQVLNAGRGLILLDGLDEVGQDFHDRVLREIQLLFEAFNSNHFVMTCRVASWEYTFDQFTEVEIADFNPAQMKTFAWQWFQHKAVNASTFLRKLSQRPDLAELAVTPLLLTLLCLAFESSGWLPSSRSELYQEGITTLLKKWDASRGIHRDQVYKRLSTKRKEDLLGKIALKTFKQGQYFFQQRRLEAEISDYICHLPEASEDSEVLMLDSSTILRSIEAQHGLLVERAKHMYSFSHLTFHEYFVARELVYNSGNSEALMPKLVDSYALNPQWREVFLLISELLPNADWLLEPLAVRSHALLASSPKLQDFLADITQQATLSCFEGFKPAAVRAFLFDIDFDIDQRRAVAVRLDRSINRLVGASFLRRVLEGVSLEQAIAMLQRRDQQVNEPQQQIARADSADDAMIIAVDAALASQQLNPKEGRVLEDLAERSHHSSPEDEDYIQEVADAARKLAKDRYRIGQRWQFDEAEKQLLEQYYRATRLLVDCLYSDGSMLSQVRRRAIESTLFSPLRWHNHADQPLSA